MTINIAIIGASGLSGGELCRLLLSHKQVGKIYPVSRKTESFEIIHPNLLGSGLRFYSFNHVIGLIDQIDVVFFCTPSGEAMKSAQLFLQNNVKVIDLSADFRFTNPTDYKNIYGKEHQDKVNLKSAIYGISELNRNSIKSAQLIANPGCYVITSVLALMPILKSPYIHKDQKIHISAINGTSGAGSKPKAEIMHTAVNNNILPYSLDGHRHCPELEIQLSKIAQRDIKVVFSTAHGSFVRGIYSQISVTVDDKYRNKINRSILIDLYKNYYGENGQKEPFIMIVDKSRTGKLNSKEYRLYPNIAHVTGSNFCHIGMDYDGYSGTIKLIAITDNLVKGAAGSGMQNMNIMFGFDEKEGLRQYGL